MKPMYFARSLQEWDEQTRDWAFVGYADDVWDLIDMLVSADESLVEWECFEQTYDRPATKMRFPCIKTECGNINDWPEMYCEKHRG